MLLRCTCTYPSLDDTITCTPLARRSDTESSASNSRVILYRPGRSLRRRPRQPPTLHTWQLLERVWRLRHLRQINLASGISRFLLWCGHVGQGRILVALGQTFADALVVIRR